VENVVKSLNSGGQSDEKEETFKRV